MKKLRDYLVGLKILNRTTGEFLDEKSFRPLLVDISESVVLTQGENPKYRHQFFIDILDSCICSRLATQEDIENYSKGFFVHATPDSIDEKEKEFACCLLKSSSSEDREHDDEDQEPWEFEFEHGHQHEEGYDYISDAIVERTILLDLEKKEVENSVESIIFQLRKFAYVQKELKEQNEELNSNNIQLAFPLVGAFYTNKKRKERQDILNKEMIEFDRFVTTLKGIPEVSYQRIEDKNGFIVGFVTGVPSFPENDSKKNSERFFKIDTLTQISSNTVRKREKSSGRKLQMKRAVIPA